MHSFSGRRSSKWPVSSDKYHGWPFLSRMNESWDPHAAFCNFRALKPHVRMQSWADGLPAVQNPKRHSPNFGCHRRNRIISQILPFGHCSSHAGMETTIAGKQHIPDVKALEKTREKNDRTGWFWDADPFAFTWRSVCSIKQKICSWCGTEDAAVSSC